MSPSTADACRLPRDGIALGLDVLVCSAGIATSAPVIETTIEDWERNHQILARGYFLAAREAFRVLIEQGTGGSLVFVGSKNAIAAGANASAYSSEKAAAFHLARCLADEGGAHRGSAFGSRPRSTSRRGSRKNLRRLPPAFEGWRTRTHRLPCDRDGVPQMSPAATPQRELCVCGE